jgi:hypothetical protein
LSYSRPGIKKVKFNTEVQIGPIVEIDANRVEPDRVRDEYEERKSKDLWDVLSDNSLATDRKGKGKAVVRPRRTGWIRLVIVYLSADDRSDTLVPAPSPPSPPQDIPLVVASKPSLSRFLE